MRRPRIQMYVCEASLAGETRVVTYSQRFRVKEKKEGGVAIRKAPKHHVHGANLELGFRYKHAGGVLARFSLSSSYS